MGARKTIEEIYCQADEKNVGEERWRITGDSSLKNWVNGDGRIHIRYAGKGTESSRKYLLLKCHPHCGFATARHLCSIGGWKFASVIQHHEYVGSSEITVVNENERERRGGAERGKEIWEKMKTEWVCREKKS